PPRTPLPPSPPPFPYTTLFRSTAALHPVRDFSNSERVSSSVRNTCTFCLSTPGTGGTKALLPVARISLSNGSEEPSSPWTTCDSDRKSTRLNSSHLVISYAVFC